jgi:CubicO group peptidase (beta-lactamase class C family)
MGCWILGLRLLLILAFVLALVSGLVASEQEPAVPAAMRVDAVFGKWSGATPGCVVGVAQNGRKVLERAYGLADLERETRNKSETVFEAASVAKQFTAAAVLLLAREGRLSLDDPARKFVPELPDYGTPITIRHLLTHTSGLRDWGEIAAIAGWPRERRLHTQSHVLDIVHRQRALNFAPGAHWSYTNTGYNLAAIIVARVSGQTFPEFTRQRIFEPLGMERTAWRDDHTRLVRGRALGYREARDGYHTALPFESVYGQGGLLTTVGDLLRWNENFERPKVGDAELLREAQQAGKLSDGRDHGYALGLWVGTYKGVPEIAHGGMIEGYTAFLARYPQQRLSVAVLCNVAPDVAEPSARAVADIFLGSAASAAPLRAVAVPAADLDSRAGLWRNTVDGTVLSLVRDKAGLKVENGQSLVAVSPVRFVPPQGGQAFEFDGADRLMVGPADGIVQRYERVAAAKPTPEQLQELAGIYVSQEAEVALGVAVHQGELLLERRPDTVMRLRPQYTDAFDSPVGLVRFRRADDGRVSELSLTQDRVWDLRFRRQ